MALSAMLSSVGASRTRMLSGPVVSVTVVDVVVVLVVVTTGTVVMVVVVGQSPSAISSSFVLAPAMQVPALPPVLSALLQPHLPTQSLPHLKLEQGVDVDDVVMVVVDVDVDGVAVIVVV